MGIPFRRTMVIGLGGTGVMAVRHMKRNFLERFGKMPKAVQILCFDTNTDKAEENLFTTTGLNVELLGQEFTHLTSEPPEQVLAGHAEVRRWFPKEEVPGFAVIAGAQQYRALGRLALFARAVQVIYPKLENAYSTLLSQDLSDELKRQNPEFELSEVPRVTVYIVGSLGGGTGSGMFLDMAYLCRHLFQANGRADDRIVGLFLLPGAFAETPGTAYVEGNAYAALKELDYLMSTRIDEGEVVYYGTYENETIRVRWGIPFNQFYLVGDRAAGLGKIRELQHIYKFLGEILFSQCTVLSTSAQDILDTVTQQQARVWPSGKRAWYGGIGMARLELPIDKLIQIAIYEKIDKSIAEMLSFQDSKLITDIDRYMRDWGLEEEKADEVIQYMIPAAIKTSPLENLHRLGREECLQKLKGWRRTQAEQVHAQYIKIAEEHLEKKLAEVRKKLDEFIHSRLHERGGVTYIVNFLNGMLNRIKLYQEIMTAEQRNFGGAFSTILENIKQESEKEQEEIKQACGAVWWRRREALKRLVNNLKEKIDEDSEKIMQLVRREYAIKLYNIVYEEVRNEYLVKLERLQEALVAARATVQNELAKLQYQRPIDPFTKELKKDFIMPELDQLDKRNTTDSILARIRDGGSLLNWLPNADAVVKNLSKILQTDYNENLRKISIDTVLRRFMRENSDGFYRFLRNELISRAATMWECHAFEIAPSEFFIFEVFNAEETIINEIDAGQVGLFKGHYQCATSGDPYSITAIKFSLSVPAHAIVGLERMKNSYLRDEMRADFTYHIHRKWAGVNALPDLFPLPSETAEAVKEEQRLYWALALIEPFKLIVRKPSGQYYLCVGEKRIPLGETREEAFDKLVKDRTLYDELRSRIKAKLDEYDDPTPLIEQLENAAERLREHAPYSNKEEAELDARALERFAEELLRFK